MIFFFFCSPSKPSSGSVEDVLASFWHILKIYIYAACANLLRLASCCEALACLPRFSNSFLSPHLLSSANWCHRLLLLTATLPPPAPPPPFWRWGVGGPSFLPHFSTYSLPPPAPKPPLLANRIMAAMLCTLKTHRAALWLVPAWVRARVHTCLQHKGCGEFKNNVKSHWGSHREWISTSPPESKLRKLHSLSCYRLGFRRVFSPFFYAVGFLLETQLNAPHSTS